MDSFPELIHVFALQGRALRGGLQLDHVTEWVVCRALYFRSHSAFAVVTQLGYHYPQRNTYEARHTTHDPPTHAQ